MPLQYHGRIMTGHKLTDSGERRAKGIALKQRITTLGDAVGLKPLNIFTYTGSVDASMPVPWRIDYIAENAIVEVEANLKRSGALQSDDALKEWEAITAEWRALVQPERKIKSKGHLAVLNRI